MLHLDAARRRRQRREQAVKVIVHLCAAAARMADIASDIRERVHGGRNGVALAVGSASAFVGGAAGVRRAGVGDGVVVVVFAGRGVEERECVHVGDVRERRREGVEQGAIPLGERVGEGEVGGGGEKGGREVVED